jgi:hypothetical protein
MVLHRCDNRWCVNYEECLFLGTNSDNMKDAWNKGRGKHFVGVGEENPRAKLTEEDVREIRRLYATGTWRQKDLAEEFGVANTNISSIVLNKTWVLV